MSTELYQRAKVVFAELVELTAGQQRSALERLEATDPELASEVRSLLRYHSSHTLVVEPAARKIQTRTSITTSQRAFSWRKFLSRDPWRLLLIGLPALLALLIANRWVCESLRESIGDLLATQLNQAIDSHVSRFHSFEQASVARASLWARTPEVTSPALELVAIAKNHRPEAAELRQALAEAPCSAALSAALEQLAGKPVKFSVWDRRMLTLADYNQKEAPEILGQSATADGAAMLTRVMAGQPLLSLPKLQRTARGGHKMESAGPTVAIILPIQEPSGSIAAALMVRGYGLEPEFRQLTQPQNDSATCEVYLVNSSGVMLTPSKAMAVAKRPEIITELDSGDRESLVVRDPGCDLTSGERPLQVSPTAWPLTHLASELTAGRDGSNTNGYRNYLGEVVVGAWRWLPEYEIGFAIEEDYRVAYAPYLLVHRSLAWFSGLLGLSLLGVAFTSAWFQMGRRKEGALREVGPYKILEILGEGGMGRVYLAEHLMLRRPTAVKILHADPSDPSSLARFEREVQLTCQLTHPNTISIYDFGQTTSGIFYYTMEYVSGAHLGQLLEYAGPLPPGRCVYILDQLCRALREAHQAGLVHRDIKPQNVMICNRGGEPDFVKLFDYGLVKAFAPGVDDNAWQTKVVVGTPRFMAPERMASPWLADPRVDIYSVGALAYFLLTGQLPPLISSARESGVDALPAETVDLPPSVSQFGQLLSSCMSINPALRPANISVVLQLLQELASNNPWTPADAAQWWKRHDSRLLDLVKEKRERLPKDSLTQ